MASSQVENVWEELFKLKDEVARLTAENAALTEKLAEAREVAQIILAYHMVKGFDPAEVDVRDRLRKLAGEVE